VKVLPARGQSTTAAVGILFAGILTLVGTPLGLLLLALATTGRGRLGAIAALLVTAGPLFTLLSWRRRRLAWRKLAVATAAGSLGLGLWLALTAPGGRVLPAGRVFSAFPENRDDFPALAPANLIPEVDQLMLGFTLMTVPDPLLTLPQAEQLRDVTAAVYAELARDPDFAALRTAMPLAYGEVLGGCEPAAHAYVYVPATLRRDQPAPVLVFFHGSGGNFTGYLWVLSKVADQLGCVLVAPSFGMGNWHSEASRACFEFALQAAARAVPVDRHRIQVAGLSNGGLAVSQLLAAGIPAQSFILLSPVFDRGSLQAASREFLSSTKVLVLTGQKDDRVPLDYVEAQVAGLRVDGARVELSVVADAGHFLVFSHRSQLEQFLANRLRLASGP
jgi:predicted esterase